MAGVFHQCGQSICKRTRDEMDDRARIIARALAEQGVCDNDVVAIFMRNHVDIFEIVEACRYVGSRYVLPRGRARRGAGVSPLDLQTAVRRTRHWFKLTCFIDLLLGTTTHVFYFSFRTQLFEFVRISIC